MCVVKDNPRMVMLTGAGLCAHVKPPDLARQHENRDQWRSCHQR
jgi:hypothetical protein